MIVIQVLLIGGIVTIFAWFIMNPGSQQVHAWIKILAAALTTFGVVVIISPNTSNRIARAIGVGRGADLLLYALAGCVSVLDIQSVYARERRTSEVRGTRQDDRVNGSRDSES